MTASKELRLRFFLSFNITECGICLEPFKKPKALPCLHTFCLECLEKYGKDEVPEAKLPCPSSTWSPAFQSAFKVYKTFSKFEKQFIRTEKVFKHQWNSISTSGL